MAVVPVNVISFTSTSENIVSAVLDSLSNVKPGHEDSECGASKGR